MAHFFVEIKDHVFIITMQTYLLGMEKQLRAYLDNPSATG